MHTALFRSQIIATRTSYHYSNYLGAVSVDTAVKLGAMLSMLSATVEIPHTAFGGKPIGLFVIDKGFDIAILMTCSAIMGYFN